MIYLILRYPQPHHPFQTEILKLEKNIKIKK